MYIEFKTGEKYANKDAPISDDMGHFKDAGYILTDNDVVVDIDCLNKEVIKKMLLIFNIKTETVWTDRGIHLYFKKSASFSKGANRMSTLGVPVELKHSKNTKAITVKRNGVERVVENRGVREDLPNIFSINKKFDNLMGLDDNEGRNQALFKHRQQLANIDGWERMLRFINENIFSTPLSEEEFQSITRDMNVVAEKDKEPELAEYFMNTFKIVSFDKKIYFRYKDRYVTDNDLLIRLIFDKVGNQKTRYIDEIFKQIEYRCKVIDADKEFDIKFKNGILRKGKFIEVDYDDFTPYVIDIDYIEDSNENVYVDNYLKHMTQGDKKYEDLIYEILAHCLITDKDFKRMLAKFFIFIGNGSNGKGTLLQIIKTILGRENVTGMSINNMSDERYLMSLKGKLANLGDDIQDEPIDNEMMKNLKNISTCDTIEGRMLYQQSKTVTLSASLIFTSNHVLKSFEKGNAYKRRVMWLPMFTVVKDNEKDINFIAKLTSKEALEYWISKTIKAYFRLYENGKFTHTDIVDKYNAEYHKENNTSLMFLEDYEIEHVLGKKPPEIHDEYETWAEENGCNVASKKMFGNTVEEYFNVEVKVASVNGKSMRVYVRKVEE